jgi:hypothetical protein
MLIAILRIGLLLAIHQLRGVSRQIIGAGLDRPGLDHPAARPLYRQSGEF